jgi:hypothetical protein
VGSCKTAQDNLIVIEDSLEKELVAIELNIIGELKGNYAKIQSNFMVF